MIRFIAVVKRKEGLSFEDFERLWCGEHPELVVQMPGLRSYTQKLAHKGETREWDMDGVAEIAFDDDASLKAAFASPEGQAANRHQDTFAGDVRWFLAQERSYEVPQ